MCNDSVESLLECTALLGDGVECYNSDLASVVCGGKKITKIFLFGNFLPLT